MIAQSVGRTSHSFRAQTGEQFDAVLHFDRARAVEPLETYPTGI